MEHRYNIHTDEAWLYVSGCRNGLVQSPCAFLDAFEYHGTAFCIEALHEALRHGKPDIFNTDLGSQFTGKKYTGVLK